MELTSILNQCLSYPSGDNCQPFRFKILGDSEFEIHHDEDVARHRLNISSHASCLSLGTLLETISLVASNSGYKAVIELFFPAGLRTRGLQRWASVRLVTNAEPPSEADKELHAAIPLRAVKRTRYESENLPEDVVRWLKFEAARNPNIAFSFQNVLSPDLTAELLDIEEETWKDIRLAKDILKWIRFSKSSAEKSRDGMTWKSLGLPFFQKPFLKLFTLFPSLYKVSTSAGSTKGQRKSLEDSLTNSGGFGWIALSGHDHMQVVSVGRTYFRMWLFLTGRGYAFQPLSLATFPAYAHAFGALPEDWPAALHPRYQNIVHLIQRDMKVSANWIPIWGFRTGKSDPSTQTARCLRKDLADVSLTG